MEKYTFNDNMKRHLETIEGHLANALEFYQDFKRQKQSFNSKRPIAAELNETNISGPIIGQDVDISGRVIGRHYLSEERKLSLTGRNYDQLTKIVDQLLKTSWVSLGFGREFLEEEVFRWACERKAGDGVSLAYCIEALAEKHIKDRTIYVPLASIEVASNFRFGPVEIVTIDQAFLQRMQDGMLSVSQKHKEDVLVFTEKLKERVQGFPAVVVNVNSAPDYAHRRALEIADDVASFLRLLSGAAFSPWLTCSVAPMGSEYVKSSISFSLIDNGSFAMHEGMRSRTPSYWQLTTEQLAHFREGFIQLVEQFIDTSMLNGFGRQIRSALLTYSRALASDNINDRLVYTFSALESLFLKDASEAIQQNVAERIAFLTKRSVADRVKLIQGFKQAYKLRSRYVHHGLDLDDRSELESFQMNVFEAFYAVMNQAKRYDQLSNFLSAIDEVKFGGG